MSDDGAQRQSDPEERALDGSPDHPPQQADNSPESDREILDQDVPRDEEAEVSGKAAPDGSGGSDQPGTTLPGYG